MKNILKELEEHKKKLLDDYIEKGLEIMETARARGYEDEYDRAWHEGYEEGLRFIKSELFNIGSIIREEEFICRKSIEFMTLSSGSRPYAGDTGSYGREESLERLEMSNQEKIQHGEMFWYFRGKWDALNRGRQYIEATNLVISMVGKNMKD